jgi:uncharacterized protein YciI
MYIVNLNYLKPVSEVDTHVVAHRAFLDEYYARGVFIASGPRNPRDGGVIIASSHASRAELDDILAKDPFSQHGIASYQVTEFVPTKHHPMLTAIL